MIPVITTLLEFIMQTLKGEKKKVKEAFIVVVIICALVGLWWRGESLNASMSNRVDTVEDSVSVLPEMGRSLTALCKKANLKIDDNWFDKKKRRRARRRDSPEWNSND